MSKHYTVGAYDGFCRFPGCDGGGKINFRYSPEYGGGLASEWEDCPDHPRCDSLECGGMIDERGWDRRPVSVRVVREGRPTYEYAFCERACLDDWLRHDDTSGDEDVSLISLAVRERDAKRSGSAFASGEQRDLLLEQLRELSGDPRFREMADFIAGDE